jgi:hypothetical protein
LTVDVNSRRSAIGIVAPTDSKYRNYELAVTVTGLPTDVTVYLANGAAVTNGERLTIRQLTGLTFKPSPGTFGQSSTFTYKVTDPSGLTASGSATLAIAPDSKPPVTTPASLSVAENSAPTAIGIAAPTDPNYRASQLSVTVTGLPSDGTVYLADGATAVTNGESLTVAQLIGLMFKPTPGAFGKGSTLTYTVRDPSGLSASGSASLAIGSAPPALSTKPASLTLAENAGPAAIGIAAPTDPNYTASQLSIRVSGLPSDGTVLLSDGITQVTTDESLTVAQLTGLMFKPTAGAFGKSSTFTYTVNDPSGLSATGIASLAIGADTTPPSTSSALLTVAENAAPTAIGIAAPTDPNYPALQLSVTVTGLPSDGAVLLSDGITQVMAGEALTVAQLTGLMFKPIAGTFETSSILPFTVTDPPGLSATGTATLGIGPDTVPPTTSAGSLTVAQNSVPTRIGITAPTDPNYSASQLTVKVTGLPTDGTVLLSDGITQVMAGEVLTVAQLTGLMFKPPPGAFGKSSTFTYTVSDPSGLSATGAASLAIGANTTPPSTSPASLMVAENAAPAAIGIAAPSDSNYAASQLTVKVTGLPGDGVIFLSDGSTQIAPGAVLSAAQLTGLMFQPTAGMLNTNSVLTYTVTDPSGLSATGSATLAIAPDNIPPVTTDPTLTVAPNSGPTPIGIAAPIDANYTALQLSVTVTGLPSDGTVYLSDGTTVVTNGESLSVAQLTGLTFKPTPGLASQSSQFSYTVKNPAGLSASGIETLAIGASGSGGPQPGLWADPPSGAIPAAGVDIAPRVAQPSQTGDIVGVRLQNTGSSTEASGYVSFGQVFLAGAVRPGDSLVARINGVKYAVQMDVKSTNADGSVRQAVLTLNAPAIAAGATLDLILAKGTAAGFSGSAPSASALLASGYDTSVSFTFHNANGTTTTDSASAATALRAALSAGTVKNWLSGPGGNEYDVVTTVDGGKLKVEFDIRAYANGTTQTNVTFDNGWMFSPGKTNLNYDVSINQGGKQVYSAIGVNQYLYSMWHHEVGSAGTISPNVQYDVPYLMAAGAIPAYDTSYGVSDAGIQANYTGLNPTNTRPMGTAEVDPHMGDPGARPDIAIQPDWVAQWLMSQNATARAVMMANADASGSVPWHFTDENTSKPINEQTYPTFFQSSLNNGAYWITPANGWPAYESTTDPWGPETSHMPDLNYISYLTTGSHYQLDLLQAAADYAITSTQPYYAYNSPNPVDPSNPGSAIYMGVATPNLEERAIAWGIRQVAEAAYATPDSDPLKVYFTSALDAALNGLAQHYITNSATASYGTIQGFILGSEGASGTETPIVSPWQEDYIVTALAEVAGMNIPTASADAVQMLQYMNNFVAGLYTNGPNGYNPFNGAAYWLYLNDPTTGTPYTTWAQFQQGNVADYSLNAASYGLPSANPTTFAPSFFATDMQGGYAITAKAALADEITYTQSPQAIQAYGFVVSQVAGVWSAMGGGETAAWQTDPMWNLMPKLPDGVYLPNSQMQIETSGASSVALTANGGDSLLAVVGSGTATLSGGTGSCDLLFGGSGPTTLKAGTGNDYLFGGSASNTFVDSTGNNYMHGGSGANTYVFRENNSGHDTIANFNISTDHLQIGANLDGNGITTAAQLIAGANVSNGNTVLHLSAKDDITLLGVGSPATLAHSILVS